MRMRLTGVAALFAAAVLLAGCENSNLFGPQTAEAPPAEPAPAASSPALAAAPAAPEVTFSADQYQLGPGDQIRIIVFGSEDLSGEFEVGPQGDIAYPLIGQVTAGGKTLQEVEADIAGRLRPDYLKDPRVNVEVLNYRPFFVLGEVRRPGSFPYQSGMNVQKAIALAGGFTYRAAEDEVLITRSSDPSKGKMKAGMGAGVLPGDTIEIEERFF
jgi:protein involved in polysaccharide export with SLBB domain